MLSKNILLSIIIPAYNSERFIQNMLSMLLSQGLEDCEVIVVNDGSHDKTKEICLSYSDKYSSIKTISIENSGVSVARNTGMAAAQGEYIYFLDSDDTLAPNTLSFFKEIVKNHDAIDVFAFGYETRKDNKTFKKYRYGKYSGLVFNEPTDFLKLYFSKRINCHICSVVFLRRLLLKNQLLFNANVKIGEDIEFLIRAFSFSNSFYYNARLCFIYQIRNDSTMAGYNGYSIEQFNSFLLIKECITSICMRIPFILEEANFFLSNSYCSNLFYYLYSHFKDNEINHRFISHKKTLNSRVYGAFFRFIIILITRIIPLKILFIIFKKI
jgi:glycosyltransferase involved in cell wall biosynthesis